MKRILPLTVPRIALLAVLLAFAASDLSAASVSASWIPNGGGSWGTGTNWTGGVPAGGADATATFNTNIPTGESIITLGASRTIGNLTFGDTTPTAGARWQISASGGFTLTLDGTTPTITVNEMGDGVNSVLSIYAPLAGTDGLHKAGIGTLDLNGNNNGLTGGFTVTGGVLRSAVADAVSGTVNVSTGAIWRLAVDNTTTTVTGLSGSGIVEAAGSGIRILTLGNGSATSTFSGIIQSNNDANQTMSLTKVGAGTLTLSGGSSTYKGVTRISGGTLSVSTLANGGANSSIGASTSAATNLVFDGGTLQYTGANATSNRAFTIIAGKTATIETANNLSFAGATGTATSGALTKTGAGSLALTGVNTYTGSTLVSGGTLLISGTGTINSTSGVTVSTGGTLRYDSSVGLNRNVTLNGGRFANNSVSNYTGTLTFNSGTLGGSNLSGQTLSIGTNQILAPGNSTGTLSAGATTWANGGTLQFEINDATGTAGSTTAGWDLFTPTTLDITAGVAQFTVQILSLDSLQASGLAQNFIDSNNYQWLLVDAGAAITGFNADRFVLNASGFQNAYTGSFSISQGTGLDTDKLYLNYAAVPEPSTTLLLAGALTALIIFRRRRA